MGPGSKSSLTNGDPYVDQGSVLRELDGPEGLQLCAQAKWGKLPRKETSRCFLMFISTRLRAAPMYCQEEFHHPVPQFKEGLMNHIAKYSHEPWGEVLVDMEHSFHVESTRLPLLAES